MTIPCSIKGTIIEALHDPTVEASIMSEFLAKTLLGNMPLAMTDRLFTSPSRLIFECRGIATAMPIIMEKTEVRFDIHIYPIIDFDLLLGYPLQKLLTTSEGSLDKKLTEIASATATSCLENPMVKSHPKQNPLEIVMRVSPFISS
jgi:hypothetical protein